MPKAFLSTAAIIGVIQLIGFLSGSSGQKKFNATNFMLVYIYKNKNNLLKRLDDAEKELTSASSQVREAMEQLEHTNNYIQHCETYNKLEDELELLKITYITSYRRVVKVSAEMEKHAVSGCDSELLSNSVDRATCQQGIWPSIDSKYKIESTAVNKYRERVELVSHLLSQTLLDCQQSTTTSQPLPTYSKASHNTPPFTILPTVLFSIIINRL